MLSARVVAVIGAGNVGCALAGDLALRGVEVRLFNRSPGRLEQIRAAGGIRLSGEVEGFGRPSVVTESLAEAVDGAEVVAVTVPSSALPAYAASLAGAITDDQLIWLDPGHSGGALYLAAEIERITGRRPRHLCQLTTASHIARMTGPGAVRVFLRARASVAALPAGGLDRCHDLLDALLPGQLGKLGSVLEADLSNINAVLHPPGMVLNAGWIEATGGGFGFYADGNTPAVAEVMEAIDRERRAVAEKLDIAVPSLSELFCEMGFTSARNAQTACAAIEASELIHPIKAPDTIDHRYLHEDVGWGLVPWLELAAAIGCPTPTMSAITHLAGLINGVDYTRAGLTLEAMGLAEMSGAEIRALTISGDGPRQPRNRRDGRVASSSARITRATTLTDAGDDGATTTQRFGVSTGAALDVVRLGRVRRTREGEATPWN
jgi:opine dehydrogenase